MRNAKNRARRMNAAAALVLAAGVITIAACDRIKNELLEPQNPGLVTQARGYITDAIAAEKQFEPQKTSDIGELYAALAFIEVNLAESFCNGIPLGSNKQGVVDYSSPDFKPLTNAEVYVVALGHVDN